MPVALVPTRDAEQALWQHGCGLVAGVDEVGRGAAVGPVVAAAVVLPRRSLPELAAVRDSKLLSASHREELARVILAVTACISIGAASASEVDELNVRVATVVAMRRALDRLHDWDHAIVDGLPMRELAASKHTALVDADATSLPVACASIIAKVTRDRLLRQLAVRYPNYGWEHNAGYLTAEHRTAITVCGTSPHHRQRFLTRLHSDENVVAGS